MAKQGDFPGGLSMEQAMAFAASPAGQQLMRMLQQSSGADFQKAQEYAAAGTGFADGASGKPGTYVDCSGLIFQCLYAAGINPDVSIIDHARVVYEFTSNYLGNDWQMGVAVSYAQPGDLIFYGNSGSINHVAIYAGNGMIYDSWPGIGVSYRSMYSGGTILKIVRVF